MPQSVADDCISAMIRFFLLMHKCKTTLDSLADCIKWRVSLNYIETVKDNDESQKLVEAFKKANFGYLCWSAT